MIDLPPVDPNQITYQVIERAAEITQTPVVALYLILKAEGGTMGECIQRKYNADCGPFQMNTMHFEELRELGLTSDLIVNSPLGNALSAGVILRKKIKVCKKYGYDWFGTMACYHNFNAPHRITYRQHLIEHAQSIMTPAEMQRYLKPYGTE